MRDVLYNPEICKKLEQSKKIKFRILLNYSAFTV